ncbi:MAG TPA: FecR domain-containing protein [Longimicrobiaceae bacterium]|nr:FecR domain-containing protein [Longimicrobiaceae bacterium]
MDELILRALHHSISEEEERELEAWRRASDENEAYYGELRRMLEVASSTVDVGSVPPRPPLDALVGPTRARSPGIGAGPTPRRRRGGIGILAGLAVAAAVAAVLVQAPPHASAPGFSLGEAEYATGPGESRTVTLPDHSVVKLGPSTHLRTSGARGVRDVFLDGRAYFAVAKMNGLPFQVRTASGKAVVHGTQFEITTDPAGARLVVFEGRVALQATRTSPVEVGAGEVSTISNGTVAAPKRVEDPRKTAGWLGHFIVFQSTPVPEVARELQQVYHVPVEVTDSTLSRQSVTGWYDDEPFDEVFEIVCGVLQAQCTIHDGVAKIGG